MIYGVLRGDGECLASWHFVSRSPRFRGVVNQADTSRPQRDYTSSRTGHVGPL